MLIQRLGIKQLPNSIFKLINEEDVSGAKLLNLVGDVFGGNLNNQKVEIRLIR
jgi:hypothetical protein